MTYITNGSFSMHMDSPRPVPAEWYAEHGPCCFAAANTEGDSCDCWIPVLWPEHETNRDGHPIREEGPQNVKREMCSDCAFKPTSPERAKQDGAPLDYGPDRPFTCHTAEGVDHYSIGQWSGHSMPRVTVWVHPPSGVTMPVTEDDYKPVSRGNRSWLADGSPAPFCAGWGAVNRIRS